MSRYQLHDWRLLEKGSEVELRQKGQNIRAAVIDDVMPDGSGLWTAGNGVTPRTFVLRGDGCELWVDAETFRSVHARLRR